MNRPRDQSLEHDGNGIQKKKKSKRRPPEPKCLKVIMYLPIAFLCLILMSIFVTFRIASSLSRDLDFMDQLHSSEIAVMKANNQSVAADPADGQSRQQVRRQNSPPEGLQIAWLMSFPNSGTSYTSRLVRDATKTFSGSNYADETTSGTERGVKRVIFDDQPSGPFWIQPEEDTPGFTKPTKWVLTKTHCGIRCNVCPPQEYAETTYSYRRRCFVTRWVNVDSSTGRRSRQYALYSPNRVTKAIHLFRNPFDNVVSRFHLERERADRTAKNFSANREGFRQYCASIDALHKPDEIKYAHFQTNKILQNLWRVPCHAEFMRYVEWHNLAFFTTDDLDIDIFVLHYEWYTSRFERTVQELLEFLGLQKTAEATPFQSGKAYDHFYTNEEKVLVKRAFEFMASRRTWEHVKQYFPDG